MYQPAGNVPNRCTNCSRYNQKWLRWEVMSFNGRNLFTVHKRKWYIALYQLNYLAAFTWMSLSKSYDKKCILQSKTQLAPLPSSALQLRKPQNWKEEQIQWSRNTHFWDNNEIAVPHHPAKLWAEQWHDTSGADFQFLAGLSTRVWLNPHATPWPWPEETQLNSKSHSCRCVTVQVLQVWGYWLGKRSPFIKKILLF